MLHQQITTKALRNASQLQPLRASNQATQLSAVSQPWDHCDGHIDESVGPLNKN